MRTNYPDKSLTGYPKTSYSGSFFQDQVDRGIPIQPGNYLVRDNPITLDRGTIVRAAIPGTVRLYAEKGHALLSGFRPIDLPASCWPSGGGFNLDGLRMYFPASYYSYPRGKWGNNVIEIDLYFPKIPVNGQAIWGLYEQSAPKPVAMIATDNGVMLWIASANGTYKQLFANLDWKARNKIKVTLLNGLTAIYLNGALLTSTSYPEPLVTNVDSLFCIGAGIEHDAWQQDCRPVGPGMILFSFQIDDQPLMLPPVGSVFAGQGGLVIDSNEAFNYADGQTLIDGIIVELLSPYGGGILQGLTQQSVKISNCYIGNGTFCIGTLGSGPCYMMHLDNIDTFYGQIAPIQLFYGMTRYNNIRMNFPGRDALLINGSSFMGSGLWVAPGGPGIEHVVRAKAMQVHQLLALRDMIADFESFVPIDCDILVDVSQQSLGNQLVVSCENVIMGGGPQSNVAIELIGEKADPKDATRGILRIPTGGYLSARPAPEIIHGTSWIVEGAVHG